MTAVGFAKAPRPYLPGGVPSSDHPTKRSISFGTTKNRPGEAANAGPTVPRLYAKCIAPALSPARSTSAIAGGQAAMVGTPPSKELAVRVIPGITEPCANLRARGCDELASAESRLSRAQCTSTASTARWFKIPSGPRCTTQSPHPAALTSAAYESN